MRSNEGPSYPQPMSSIDGSYSNYYCHDMPETKILVRINWCLMLPGVRVSEISLYMFYQLVCLRACTWVYVCWGQPVFQPVSVNALASCLISSSLYRCHELLYYCYFKGEKASFFLLETNGSFFEEWKIGQILMSFIFRRRPKIRNDQDSSCLVQYRLLCCK